MENLYYLRETYSQYETEELIKNLFISNLRKRKEHYTGWDITVSLGETFREIVEAGKKRLAK